MWQQTNPGRHELLFLSSPNDKDLLSPIESMRWRILGETSVDDSQSILENKSLKQLWRLMTKLKRMWRIWKLMS